MNKSRKLYLMIIFILLTLCVGLLVFSFFQNKETSPFIVDIDKHAQRKNDVSAKSWESTVTLAAIGDILIHDRVYEDAEIQGGYDFKPMFKHVKQYLQQPDLLLANQETLLGGVEIGLSSYPTFNSPQEVGDALIDSGVDIVSTANNHTLDRGEKAILSAIQYYENVGLPYVGHFKDISDKEKLRILSTNGIQIAYLSYTYGTNGIPVPKGKDYLVNLIDKDKMKTEIHRAKEVADVVIMSLHWGNEYQRFPTEEQKKFAQFLADEGIDVLFGHHSHVLQPMEMLTAKDGRKVFVVYSLGNFLSGQIRDYKDIGGMASVEITKKIAQNKISINIEKPQFFPTYVSSVHFKNYQVVPLQQAGSFGFPTADKKYNEIMLHMFQWLD